MKAWDFGRVDAGSRSLHKLKASTAMNLGTFSIIFAVRGLVDEMFSGVISRFAA